MRSLDSERAKFAIRCTDGLDDKQAKYLAAVNRVGPMLRQNGLVQTGLFCIGKKGEDIRVFEHIANWLRDRENPITSPVVLELNGKPLIEFWQGTLDLDALDVALLEEESRRICNWLKRVCEARSPADAGTSDQGAG
ncbi:MAG: type III-B CRISPR module-associated protein Cmr5 [Acidobacteria bacterium]|nr:type III-B CRISPR module-associated protein Cmr5 [Acidobacteriota bacterium]